MEPLLPPPCKTGGRPSKPHRPFVEAMNWMLRTGALWRDLPADYGSWKSVYTRLSRGSKSGVLQRLFEELAKERDDELVSVQVANVSTTRTSACSRPWRGGRLGMDAGHLGRDMPMSFAST